LRNSAIPGVHEFLLTCWCVLMRALHCLLISADTKYDMMSCFPCRVASS
jgi:hypothetical protein